MFCAIQTDYLLFTKFQGSSLIFLLIYFDDIVLANNDIKSTRCLKILFLKKFKLKDLGQFKFFLGLKVGKSLQGISLHQRKYALEILQDVGFLGANSVLFPMEQNLRLTRDDKELLTNLIVFQTLIGRLL